MNEKIFAEIQASFEQWGAAWNDGDLEGYLACYWDSEEARYVSGGHLVQGIDAIRAAYRNRFTTPDSMGHLTLDHLQADLLTETDAVVFGRVTLTTSDQVMQAAFTAHLRKFDGEWLMLSDHTSAISA